MLNHEVNHEGKVFNPYSFKALTDLELEIVAFLDEHDAKAKDYLLGDLSWADYVQSKEQIISDFFTKRHGKLYLDRLPEHLKNKILAYSL
jgi:predicted metal-binding protein